MATTSADIAGAQTPINSRQCWLPGNHDNQLWMHPWPACCSHLRMYIHTLA